MADSPPPPPPPPPPSTCLCCGPPPCPGENCGCARGTLDVPDTLYVTLIPIQTNGCCDLEMVTFPIVKTRGNPYSGCCGPYCPPGTTPGQQYYWFGEYVTPNNCEFVTSGSCTEPACGCLSPPCDTPTLTSTPCRIQVVFNPGACCFSVFTAFFGQCCVHSGSTNCIYPGEFLGYAINTSCPHIFYGSTGGVDPPGTNAANYFKCSGGSLTLGPVCGEDNFPVEFFSYGVPYLYGLTTCGVLLHAGYPPVGPTADFKCLVRLIISR